MSAAEESPAPTAVRRAPVMAASPPVATRTEITGARQGTAKPSHRSPVGRSVAVALSVLLAGGLPPAIAADGRETPTTRAAEARTPDSGAWLSGVDVAAVRLRDGSAALAVTVFGAPGARVLVHLAGRAPLVLRAGLAGVPQPGEAAYHGVIEPSSRSGTPGARWPERFLVQLQVGAQGTAAVVERPPALKAIARLPAAAPTPRIDRVVLEPQGTQPSQLAIRGTPGALAIAWVPGADGQLDIVPLAEHAPGQYTAALPADCRPLAVELAMGRQVATWSQEAAVRLASAEDQRARPRQR